MSFLHGSRAAVSGGVTKFPGPTGRRPRRRNRPSGETALDDSTALTPLAVDDGLTPRQRRLLAAAEVVLCSSVPTQMLVAALLGLTGVSARTATGELALPFVLALSLGDSVLLIALMVLLTRLHGESAWALWRGSRPFWREALVGVALLPVVVLIVALVLGTIQQYLPVLHNVERNPLESLALGGTGDALVFGVVAVVAGGVREELQRAFLLRRFERHLGGPLTGVIVLGTAFGLGHLLQGWDAAIATGVLGAFWAVVYLRRRSVVAPMVSHAGFNSLEVLRVALAGE